MAMQAHQIHKLIPRALKLARERANLSIEQVAHQVNIDVQSVQKHEEGAHLPRGENFVGYLRALGLDLGTFHELLLELDIEERVSAKVDPLRAEVRQLQSRVDELNRRVQRLEVSASAGKEPAVGIMTTR